MKKFEKLYDEHIPAFQQFLTFYLICFVLPSVPSLYGQEKKSCFYLVFPPYKTETPILQLFKSNPGDHASNLAAGLVFPPFEYILIRPPHAVLCISKPSPACITSPKLLHLPPNWPCPCSRSHCSLGGIRHRAGTGDFLVMLSGSRSMSLLYSILPNGLRRL